MLLNAIQKRPLYKVCIYAGPGRGKTHIGATAPKPLILLFERHGFETIRTASQMSGQPMPPVIWLRTLEQFGRVRDILMGRGALPIAEMMMDTTIVTEGDLEQHGLTREDLVKSLPYSRPETVVVDTITEAAEMVAEAIDRNGGLETKNGLTYRKLNAWGPIVSKCSGMIRAFRDLPFHVLFLAHVDERNVGTESDADVRWRPKLVGRQLWETLMKSVNACGVLVMQHSKADDGGAITRRYVQFITGESVETKVASPLRPREPADANAWFKALAGGVQCTTKTEDVVASDNAEKKEEVET